MDYEKYLSFLTTEMTHQIIGFLIGVVIAFPLIIWMCIRNKEWSVRLVFIGSGLALIVGALVFTTPYVLDISQESFVAYSGEYIVEHISIEQSAGYFAHIALEDGTKLKLSLKAVSVDPEIGFYTGNLLYSRHTNILFEYDYTQ